MAASPCQRFLLAPTPNAPLPPQLGHGPVNTEASAVQLGPATPPASGMNFEYGIQSALPATPCCADAPPISQLLLASMKTRTTSPVPTKCPVTRVSQQKFLAAEVRTTLAWPCDQEPAAER